MSERDNQWGHGRVVAAMGVLSWLWWILNVWVGPVVPIAATALTVAAFARYAPTRGWVVAAAAIAVDAILLAVIYQDRVTHNETLGLPEPEPFGFLALGAVIAAVYVAAGVVGQWWRRRNAADAVPAT